MMTCFFVWLIIVIRHARRHAVTRTEPAEHVSLHKTNFALLAGLALLIGAAQFVVHGGKGVAMALGWSPFIAGAVLVGAATSTPELATTLISRMRGHHDVGLGNILGSNIFNALFIASVAALIQPYAVKVPEILPGLGFGVLTVLLILPGKGGTLGRWRGFVLLAVYAVYVLMTVKSGGAGH